MKYHFALLILATFSAIAFREEAEAVDFDSGADITSDENTYGSILSTTLKQGNSTL